MFKRVPLNLNGDLEDGMAVPWTDRDRLIALKLYFEIPFGKIHSKNRLIAHYALQMGRTPASLSMKLANFASLDPVVLNSGRKGLSGASVADKQFWTRMTSNWSDFSMQIFHLNRELEHLEMADDEETSPSNPAFYEGFSKDVKTKVRIGQSFFRKSVLSAYDNKCCITGLDIPQLLVASHIVPWAHDPSNRLNPYNGLCLSVIHDKAFDLGLITIDDQLRVKLSPLIKNYQGTFLENSIMAYENSTLTLPTKFQPNLTFLKYHQDHIFCVA